MTMFLGLQVPQDSSAILLHQGKYIDDILEKFGFKDAKIALTPMVERLLLTSDPDGESADQTLYRSMIGSLMYLKGRPKLGLWYPKNLEFDLSNYGGCDIDMKSTSAGHLDAISIAGYGLNFLDTPIICDNDVAIQIVKIPV
ncbi:uncharacterized protein LOC111882860 [Lactuca sativa]|uniref:uncharacterized protein LOC111882860 n=1 Tax=Lactuca sativa TaxID=4236 RepID=UPI000CD93707|nr:uncharacterized protein LOC111882860 [Lactuca sativa]